MARRKPRYTHWTADTKTAFLMALRATGSVRRACAEIGRSVASPYDHRDKDPDFAAKWQAVLAEWEADAVAERRKATGADEERAMDNRVRFDGFTPLRQRAFLRALSETGSVDEACRKVCVSDVAAYNMRTKYPSFADAWDRALAQSVATLEQVAFERAVNGVEEPVWHAGRIVGTRRRYSDPLLGRMVAREDKAKQAKGGSPDALIAAAREAAFAAGGSFVLPGAKDDTDAAILKKLDALGRRALMEQAEAAEMLLAAGLIP